jgi:endonuclease YncB( thermonuclease family)
MDSARKLFVDKTYTDTPFFSFTGMSMWGRLVDVYDGDTLTIIVNVFDSFTKLHIRLQGIDAPEMRSKSKSIHDLAIQAKNELLYFFTNEKQLISRPRDYLGMNIIVCYLKCYGFDKYGRVLADVYIDDAPNSISVSDHLMQGGHAYKYDGGKKRSATCPNPIDLVAIPSTLKRPFT